MRSSKRATRSRPTSAGRAEINYTDGSLTRLAPSTEYTITKLTDKQGGRQTQGTLTVGETWNRAAKVSENGSFEVKAGGTTAAVEGTAFVFSCVKTTKTNKKGKKVKHRTCQVISVVDTVSVETPGADATLPPGTEVVVTDDVGSSTGKVTYDDFIKNQFVVDNLNLDEKAGKGGLYEITPPASAHDDHHDHDDHQRRRRLRSRPLLRRRPTSRHRASRCRRRRRARSTRRTKWSSRASRARRPGRIRPCQLRRQHAERRTRRHVDGRPAHVHRHRI